VHLEDHQAWVQRIPSVVQVAMIEEATGLPVAMIEEAGSSEVQEMVVVTSEARRLHRLAAAIGGTEPVAKGKGLRSLLGGVSPLVAIQIHLVVVARRTRWVVVLVAALLVVAVAILGVVFQGPRLVGVLVAAPLVVEMVFLGWYYLVVPMRAGQQYCLGHLPAMVEQAIQRGQARRLVGATVRGLEAATLLANRSRKVGVQMARTPMATQVGPLRKAEAISASKIIPDTIE